MSVLIRFCLIDGIKKSFNIKVEKGNVLMRNLMDLVGTEDFHILIASIDFRRQVLFIVDCL